MKVDLYRLILNELEERGCAHVQRFPPFFICAIGAHLFNLHNRKEHIFVVAGGTSDMRIHLLFCAPPGFSKTFWLEQFLRGSHAILSRTGIDIGFEAAMTEAGFVGTIRFVDGEVVPVYGAAHVYQQAILGIEEFSALTEMIKQQYARQLDTALLNALDSGWVYKRLAAGNLSYQTSVSIFCGTQPARFDLTSGLGRRFFFILFIPTVLDFKTLDNAYWNSIGRRYNPVRTDRIRAEMRKLQSDVRRIHTVHIDDIVKPTLRSYGFLHYEYPLFVRFLIGYTIMRGKIAPELVVTIDKEAKRLIEEAVGFRKQIQRGAEFSEVLIVLNEHGGKMKLYDLKERLLQYGLDWSQSSQLIWEMQRLRAITIRGENIVLTPSLRRKKPKEKSPVGIA